MSFEDSHYISLLQYNLWHTNYSVFSIQNTSMSTVILINEITYCSIIVL